MGSNNARGGRVVLVEYDAALFTPMGFADMLAQVGATWEVHQPTTTDEVIAVARDADVVAIQSIRPTINRQAIEAFTRCRCVIRAGAGYDNVDYQAATERGIMVCNTPTYCTDDVADHAMALLLSALRHIPRLDAAMRRGH